MYSTTRYTPEDIRFSSQEVSGNLNNPKNKLIKQHFENFNNVREEGERVFERIVANDYMMLLVTECQFGKGYIMSYLAYKVTQDARVLLHSDNVFIGTSASDKGFKEQMKERVLRPFRDNVFHQNDLRKTSLQRDIINALCKGSRTLLIVDEVHLGTGKDQSFETAMIQIANIVHAKTGLGAGPAESIYQAHMVLREHGLQIIMVSATPDAIAVNMATLPPALPWTPIIVDTSVYSGYLGFRFYKKHNCYREALQFTNYKGLPNELFASDVARNIASFDTPKYHLFRLNEKDSAQPLKDKLGEMGVSFRCVHMNSSRAGKEMNAAMLDVAPEIHVLVFLKEMLRQSQTISIDHIGVSYERPVKKPNTSTMTQGFPGRVAGWKNPDVAKKLVIYTNIRSVENYIKLVENGFDYRKISNADFMRLKLGSYTLRSEPNVISEGGNQRLIKPGEQLVELSKDGQMWELARRAASNKNGFVYRILKTLRDSENHSMAWNLMQDIVGKGARLGDYTTYNRKHGRYPILKVEDNIVSIHEDTITYMADILNEM